MRAFRRNLLAVGMLTTAILATAIAFLGATLYSVADAHIGRYGIVIKSDSSPTDRGGFYSELADFARSNGFEASINFSSLAVSNGEYRVYSSSLSPDSGRVERPRFERGAVDIVYPLENFPEPDLRQTVFVNGSAQDQEALTRWAASQGLETTSLTSNFVQIITNSTIPLLLILSGLLGLILGGGYSISRSREIGVHRLLGLGIVDTMRQEIYRQRRALGAAYLVWPIITAVLLYAYNSWALADVFWAIFFLTASSLTACLFLGYLGGQYLVRMTSISQSIKDKIHARPVFYSLTVIRGVSLLAALTSVAALVGAAAELSERHQLQAIWDAHRGAQEFALNTNTALETWSATETAAPFREADKAGDIYLVDPYWITWPIELEAPVLLVNQRFARHAGVAGTEDNTVTVCSPLELSASSKSTIQESLDFEAEHFDAPTPPLMWRNDCRLGRVFTYDVDFRPYSDNPILVILPPGLAPLSDRNLMSKVSQHVVLSSSSKVPAELSSGSTGSSLAFFRPREDSWQDSVRMAYRSTVSWGLNTFAAVLLVSVLVGATIITFSAAYRRKIHIAYICGRSPWWVAKQTVAIEVLFFLVTVGWLLYHLREHRIAANSHAPSTWNIGFENLWSTPTIIAIVGFGALWLLSSIWLTVRAAGTWDAREGIEPQ